jgi:hypothetical protein
VRADASVNRLGDEKRALEVRVKDRVPFLPGEFRGGMTDVQAGVVDQDVNLAVLIDCSADHALDVAFVQDIELDGQGSSPHGLDLLLELRQPRLVPAGNDQVRAGLGQRPAEILAESRLVPVTTATLPERSKGFPSVTSRHNTRQSSTGCAARYRS